jgi:nucleoside-diphosphate-sugar epimerase
MVAEKIVLVAGASGFVGSAAIERFAAGGWKVIGLSRRVPARTIPRVEYRSVDLLDRKSCHVALTDPGKVTHLVYAAVNETPGDLVASWMDPAHAARNGRMFENLLDVLLPGAGRLRHIALVHGTKAYATHLPNRPVVPLRESLPRPPHDDFYFRQEDLLWSRRGAAPWKWTVFRAPMIAGGGYGSNLNALLAIGVFASLLKAQGRDLPFPGSRDNLGVMEMLDVELLARAIVWAAESPQAGDQTFNVANGDTYVWPDLWPIIAAEIGMPVGPAEPMSVRDTVFGRAELWRELVRAQGLAVPEDPRVFLGESCSLADFALGYCARSVLTSTIKIRQAGFHDCIDTADSVVKYIRRWRAARLLPPK